MSPCFIIVVVFVDHQAGRFVEPFVVKAQSFFGRNLAAASELQLDEADCGLDNYSYEFRLHAFIDLRHTLFLY